MYLPGEMVGPIPVSFSISVDFVWYHEDVSGGLSTFFEGYQNPTHSRDPGQILTREPMLLSIEDQDIRRFKRVG
jgi:hypothetical protein